MCDRFTLWRVLTKEIARNYGWEATFMPKPYAERTGSGAHFNMSLSSLKTGKNISGSKTDKRGCGLSKIAYQFIAGIFRIITQQFNRQTVSMKKFPPSPLDHALARLHHTLV